MEEKAFPLQTNLPMFPTVSETIIKFGETKFSVSEPKEPGQSVVIKIPVIRQGDTSKVSIVRVHTKDGSATSGEDYHPVSEGMGAPGVCLDESCSHCMGAGVLEKKREIAGHLKYKDTYSFKLTSFRKTKSMEFISRHFLFDLQSIYLRI